MTTSLLNFTNREMVYLRTKTIGGNEYLYLVKSKWNSKKKTSKQEIVKYIGNASKADLSDIPEEYMSAKMIQYFLKI